MEKENMKCPECGKIAYIARANAKEFVGRLALVGTLLAMLVFLLVLLYRVIESDPEVEYCYVTKGAPLGAAYNLYGYRPWRSDTDLGGFDSIPRALEAAQQLGCRSIPLSTAENPTQ
jgi:hypothetical protein